MLFYSRGYLLQCVVLFCACAPAYVSGGAASVRVTEQAPQVPAQSVQVLRAVSGSGCGAPGQPGTRAAAIDLLRHEAAALGADYVQITAIVPPTAAACNEFTVKGIAFKLGSQPLRQKTRIQRAQSPVATPPAAGAAGAAQAAPPPELTAAAPQLVPKPAEPATPAPSPQPSSAQAPASSSAKPDAVSQRCQRARSLRADLERQVQSWLAPHSSCEVDQDCVGVTPLSCAGKRTALQCSQVAVAAAHVDALRVHTARLDSVHDYCSRLPSDALARPCRGCLPRVARCVAGGCALTSAQAGAP